MTVLDERTRRGIAKAAWSTLQDAGITQPPVPIRVLMEHLSLDRSFYDLRNPGFIDRAIHKSKIRLRKMIRAVRKSKLLAVLFYDQNRILVDKALPKLKRVWPTYHETAHRILPWHRTYFLGDTAQTLDPEWRERLESEANFGASELMFCGPVFTRDARDTVPALSSVLDMSNLHKKTITTTMRRYVGLGPDTPMAMLVSTPYWKEKPEGQEHRWRHFIPSPSFQVSFAGVRPEELLSAVDKKVHRRGGGPVGDFTLSMMDRRGEMHEFCGQTFNTTYNLLTLFVQKRRRTARRVIVAPAV